MSSFGAPRVLLHNAFYGSLQTQRELPSFTLAHRIATGLPDEIPRHTHPEAHFVLVTAGQYISTARAAAMPFPLVYNPPGTTHRDRFHAGLGSFFTVSVGRKYSAEMAGLGNSEVATFLDHPASRGIVHALLRECAGQRTAPDLRAESLCLELIGSPHLNGEEARIKSLARPQWLDQAFQLIQDGYRERLTVGRLAREAGVHPVYLARCFRRFFRCTPGDLLRLRRLQKAAALILHRDLPLADIAMHCGFTDQSHMTTAFRLVYGTSPGQY